MSSKDGCGIPLSQKGTGSSNVFSDHAEEYWRSGFSVVPVKPGSKQPAISRWTGYNNNIPKTSVQHEWLNKYGHCGIGLPVGLEVKPGFRIAAIDIDDDGYVAFVEKVLGLSVSAKKGKKGLTIFVLAESSLKSGKFGPKGHGPVVEAFVNSGYVVLPPSIHPDTGLPYEWIGTPLSDCDPSTLPVLTANKLKILETVAKSDEALTIISGGKTHDAFLALAAKGLWQWDADAPLAGALAALLPPNYEGNAREELAEILLSARNKELGQSGHINAIYDPNEMGPIPLGYLDDGRFVFRDQQTNRIAALPPQQLMSEAGLIGLVQALFWQDQFPKMGKRGETVGFLPKVAGDALMQACRLKGPFSLSSVRGRGVWIEGGDVIINLGRPIPGEYRNTYVCFEPLPEFKGAKVDGSKLLGTLSLFKWHHPTDATLLLGWLAIAPVCGALGWRPHVFLHGPKNTGKTTLVRAMSGLLAPLAIVLDGQSTEAGIRQKLGPDSLPIVLDEFESDGNRKRMEAVIKLARSASSAEGGIARGTPEGRVLEFAIRTSFLFAAINPVLGTAADASRVVQIELRPHDGDGTTKSQIERGIQWMRDVGSAWIGQAINNVQTLIETINELQVHMPPLDSRHLINMATLLGGAWVAIYHRTPTVPEAIAWIENHMDSIGVHAEAHEHDDAVDCLQHLLGSSYDNITIGTLIADAAKARDSTPDALLTMGIRVETDVFYVANKHPGLNRIFANTRWAGGGWKTALARIPGAIKFDPKRFGSGVKARCTRLPIHLLSDDDDDEAECRNGTIRSF